MPQQIKFSLLRLLKISRPIDEKFPVKISSEHQDSSKKIKQKKILPTPLKQKGYQVILFQILFTSALDSVLLFLSQVKQRKVKRKEKEVKEVEAKKKNNFQNFYKICVLVLVLRLAPKNVFGYNLRFFFHK